MEITKTIKSIVSVLICISVFLLINPSICNADIQVSSVDDGQKTLRSIESLRDLDYETWQVVVYAEPQNKNLPILRIVGYPGTLRLDHPSSLSVTSGRYNWSLDDITLSNSALVNDPREAAAEFDLSPMMKQLKNNRPLRLKLEGAFTDLPIPPYVVSEWRSLTQNNFK